MVQIAFYYDYQLNQIFQNTMRSSLKVKPSLFLPPEPSQQAGAIYAWGRSRQIIGYATPQPQTFESHQAEWAHPIERLHSRPLKSGHAAAARRSGEVLRSGRRA